MNHNEEVPDFLGGLGDMLPADVLKTAEGAKSDGVLGKKTPNSLSTNDYQYICKKRLLWRGKGSARGSC